MVKLPCCRTVTHLVVLPGLWCVLGAEVPTVQSHRRWGCLISSGSFLIRTTSCRLLARHYGQPTAWARVDPRLDMIPPAVAIKPWTYPESPCQGGLPVQSYTRMESDEGKS